MRVGFIIPNYQSSELLKKCLESIRKYHPENEIVVSDDGSDECYQKEIKVLCKTHKAKLLLSKINCGFAAVVNRGIDYSKSDVVVLCNNDIEFNCAIDEKIKEVMQNDDKIGIVGFLLYYPNGTIQHGGYKRNYEHQLLHGNKAYMHYGHGRSRDIMSLTSRYSIGVTGALQAIRKSMIKEIGVYSTKYQLAYEDIEYCLRAWHTGWRVYYVADINAIHHEGATRGNTPELKKSLGFFEQEECSQKQFYKDLAKYDLENLESRVFALNKKIPDGCSILIRREMALGDVIMMSGVVKKLRKDNPKTIIHIQSRMPFPLSNEYLCISYEEKYINKYDFVFDLDLCYEKKPNRKVWEAYADRVFGEGKYDHSEIIPSISTDYDSKLSFENYVVIHPCNSTNSRSLEKLKWEYVVQLFNAKGVKCVAVGSGPDFELSGAINLKNKTSYKDLCSLIKNAKMFVGIDSGISHIAQATDTPTVIIYTTANPKYRAWGKGVIEVVPRSKCKFCLSFTKPPVTIVDCWNELKCVKSIGAFDVIRGINKAWGYINEN